MCVLYLLKTPECCKVPDQHLDLVSSQEMGPALGEDSQVEQGQPTWTHVLHGLPGQAYVPIDPPVSDQMPTEREGQLC